MDDEFAWSRIVDVTDGMDVVARDLPAVAPGHVHAVDHVLVLVRVVRRAADPSREADRNRRMDRNPLKNLVHVHAQTNRATTANQNHVPARRNAIAMSPVLVRVHVRSRILARVPSPRITSRVHAPDPAPARHDPIQDRAIARNRRISRTINHVRHHPKITITLRSVMKVWRIEHKSVLLLKPMYCNGGKRLRFTKHAPLLYSF